jgi:carbon-monoxide dehydrogenase medium subunit
VGPVLSVNRINTYRIPFTFEYYRPRTLREALEILRSVEGAKVVAGGTDLVVDMKFRRVEPKTLVDISKLEELRYVRLVEDYVEIGGAVTLQELVESEVVRARLPLLWEAVNSMASWQVRNIATIGGNICNASPAADTAPPLLAYGAKLLLTSLDGVREVGIGEFFVGPKRSIIRPDEVLQAIRVPVHPAGYGWSFRKVSRTSFDIAKISVAVLLKVDGGRIRDPRIALGAVAPTPVRARSTERAIESLSLEEALEVGPRFVEGDIAPIDDVRSTAWYRREVAKVLLRDSLRTAYERSLNPGWVHEG